MSERTIVAISGGLSEPSSSTRLAKRLAAAAKEALARQGIRAATHTVELRALAHPITDATLTGFATGELASTIERLKTADGLIATTPVYTTSYSGLFKSFVDVLEVDALVGMPVLLGATGGTPRHSLAIDYAMRPLFAYLHADVVSIGVFAATDDWAAGEGHSSGGLSRRITGAAGEFAVKVAGTTPRAANDPYASTPSFEDLLNGPGAG